MSTRFAGGRLSPDWSDEGHHHHDDHGHDHEDD